MSNTLNFKGFVKDVKYKACLIHKLPEYDFESFDINATAKCGLLKWSSGEAAFSKWKSPKPSRTFPYVGLYNTYNSPTRITVIPILKDEGADGDTDRIQFQTFSLMNLLNVYIVLAYYESAKKNSKYENKLTAFRYDADIVNEQIAEITRYKQSALHWNRSLFEKRFVGIYEQALNSYEAISNKTKVRVSNKKSQLVYLNKIKETFENFKDISLRSSKSASSREIVTTHQREFLSSGEKASIEIVNYLGGTYYLTIDEIINEDGIWIVQESKNSTRSFLPSLSSIKDGLFKLILYSNLDRLLLNDEQVPFTTRLKLTGRNIIGSIRFPYDEKEFAAFLEINRSCNTKHRIKLLQMLNEEALSNERLEIEIGGNE